MRKSISVFFLLLTIAFAKGQDSNDNYGWNKRISFIAGGGASITVNKLYNDPIVDKSNGFVIIEEATRFKPNISLGIVYTPRVSNITRTIKIKKDDGTIADETLIEYYPRGFSFALFINPVSLSNLGSSSVSNTIDLGYGLGYRAGNFSIFLTNEYYAIRQPRDYFVNQYEGNNKSYVINGEIQNSIDPNDNSIFKTGVGVSIGLKFCYTFDIVKSYYANSKNLNTEETD